jgi:VWFA-related protein
MRLDRGVARPAVVAAALAVQTLAPAAQDQLFFRSGTESIEVDVRVTDRDGRPVRDLTKHDFTLLDDGVQQEITSWSFEDLGAEPPVCAADRDIATNARMGRLWVIFLGPGGPEGRRLALRFVRDGLGPSDQAAVVSLIHPIRSSVGFTCNKQVLIDAIERNGERSIDPRSPDKSQQTVYGYLEPIFNRLGRAGGLRKTVLWLDPPAWRSEPGRPRVANEWRAMLRAATRNNVAIYAVGSTAAGIDFLGLAGTQDQHDALRALAEETGGEAIVNASNFLDSYQRLVKSANGYYLLGYSPTPRHQDDAFHTLSIRVRRPGVTVRARPGYYAGTAVPAVAVPEPRLRVGSSRNLTASVDLLSAAAREAIRAPMLITGLTVDVFAAPFRGAGNIGNVWIGAQLRGQDFALGSGELIEVAYQATASAGSPGVFHVFKLDLSDGSRASVRATGMRFVDWLSLPKGRHQVRFVAHQPNGKTGMVVVDVEVPDFAGDAVSLSGMILASRRLAEQQTIRADDRWLKFLGSHPTAVRTFERSDVLTAYVEVYTKEHGRFPEIKATVERAGESDRRRTLETKPIAIEADGLGFTTRLALGDLSPGDYVLTFSAEAESRIVTRRILFTVTSG